MSLLQEMKTHGMADCEFNRKIWHFDNVIFPAAIDFIDRHAKAAVNPTQITLEIFNAYEEGNAHYELGRRYTKSGNPEIFTFKEV
jgi:hypothetical protein